MLKKEIKPIIQKLLLGFAAGVMIAASVWSLLIPAIEMAETQGKPAWLPASVGFMIGIVTLIGVNNLAEKIEKRNNKVYVVLVFELITVISFSYLPTIINPTCLLL